MSKQFKLSPNKIKPLATGYGACFATDKITVEGLPIRLMYRDEPDHEIDSGWRFLSGQESDDYLDNAENHGVYDVNTIANYDPAIIPYLNAKIGSAFEKTSEVGSFAEVIDWEPPND
jgi:hypothetical protein